jgi:hypothetical protein
MNLYLIPPHTQNITTKLEFLVIFSNLHIYLGNFAFFKILSYISFENFKEHELSVLFNLYKVSMLPILLYKYRMFAIQLFKLKPISNCFKL